MSTKQQLLDLCKRYGVSHDNTVHELRKKMWDNSGRVESFTWDRDMDTIDALHDLYSEEQISSLID